MGFEVLCFLTILTVVIKAFEQHDYDLISRRVELLESDKNWLTGRTVNIKYNRTLAVIVAQNLDYGLEAIFENYRFASNEYREFPMNFKRGFCETLASNDFGIQNFYACGNFTGCSLKKGQYLICNWSADGKYFPSHVPSGSYKCKIKLIYNSKRIATMEWYYKIEKNVSFT